MNRVLRTKAVKGTMVEKVLDMCPTRDLYPCLPRLDMERTRSSLTSLRLTASGRLTCRRYGSQPCAAVVHFFLLLLTFGR
jgi:hypothetical protein